MAISANILQALRGVTNTLNAEGVRRAEASRQAPAPNWAALLGSGRVPSFSQPGGAGYINAFTDVMPGVNAQNQGILGRLGTFYNAPAPWMPNVQTPNTATPVYQGGSWVGRGSGGGTSPTTQPGRGGDSYGAALMSLGMGGGGLLGGQGTDFPGMANYGGFGAVPQRSGWQSGNWGGGPPSANYSWNNGMVPGVGGGLGIGPGNWSEGDLMNYLYQQYPGVDWTGGGAPAETVATQTQWH